MPLHEPARFEMKGYLEERGKAFKLDFDVELKQFVSKPVAHAFQPKPAPDTVEQKPAVHEKRNVINKARSPVSKWRPSVSAA
jgi:hypothetical protein